MVSPVKLDDIIEGLEFQSEEHHSYLNKITAQVVTVSDDDFRAVEGEEPLEDFPEWQRDSIKIAKEILETDHYIGLPDKFDINEYELMKEFCRSIDDDDIREEMLVAIEGRGAFRMFKHNIHRYNLADDWYKFRDEAYKQIAIEWCEVNGIPFVTQSN